MSAHCTSMYFKMFAAIKLFKWYQEHHFTFYCIRQLVSHSHRIYIYRHCFQHRFSIKRHILIVYFISLLFYICVLLCCFCYLRINELVLLLFIINLFLSFFHRHIDPYNVNSFFRRGVNDYNNQFLDLHIFYCSL